MRNDIEMTRELMKLVCCNVQCTAMRVYSDDQQAAIAEKEIRTISEYLGVFADVRRNLEA